MTLEDVTTALAPDLDRKASPNDVAPSSPAESRSCGFNAQTLKLQGELTQGNSLTTRRAAILGQLIFCEGCCCGRVDRGFPAFPRDRIKAVWKERKLNSTIQLTISGCLGPCDLANVFCWVPYDGPQQWFGGLMAEEDYEAIIDWVLACQGQQRLLPVPDILYKHRFVRFVTTDNR